MKLRVTTSAITTTATSTTRTRLFRIARGTVRRKGDKGGRPRGRRWCCRWCVYVNSAPAVGQWLLPARRQPGGSVQMKLRRRYMQTLGVSVKQLRKKLLELGARILHVQKSKQRDMALVVCVDCVFSFLRFMCVCAFTSACFITSSLAMSENASSREICFYHLEKAQTSLGFPECVSPSAPLREISHLANCASRGEIAYANLFINSHARDFVRKSAWKCFGNRPDPRASVSSRFD